VKTILVKLIKPETEWSSHEQVEDILINIGGLNPRLLQKTGMTCDLGWKANQTQKELVFREIYLGRA